MRLHRTTARLLFSLVLAGTAAASAYAHGSPIPSRAAAKQIVFPVVGKTHYVDDFGAPRGQGGHEGTDIMGDWRAPLVAVEDGRVEIWTKSARAGCMLYLYGESGTTYLYIHLNNDRTPRKDNRGGCRRGVAFAPDLVDGQRVDAGQLVGFVGDSGDAAGLHPHVHFEVHPKRNSPVSPYPRLRKAAQLLFPLPAPSARSEAAPLTLTGSVKAIRLSATGERRLVLEVASVALPRQKARPVDRLVSLTLGVDGDVRVGQSVLVVTAPVELGLAAQLARPGTLEIERITSR